MAKFTILTAKKALALAYPDIEFTYGTAGRGRERGPSVCWVGGPDAATIRAAAGAPLYRWRGCNYHFVRQPTPEEWEVQRRQWDDEQRARVAAEPARRAAAKAAGIEKRKEASATKKGYLATLAKAFPGIDFDVTVRGGYVRFGWQDGPEVADVAALPGIDKWQCERAETAAFKLAKIAEKEAKVTVNRLARRLAQSKARAIRITKGIERRRVAMLPHLPRLERNPNQFILPLDFPIWEKPTVWILFGVSGTA